MENINNNILYNKVTNPWGFILNLTANEQNLLAFAVATLIGQQLERANEQGALGNFFELIGQTLVSLAAQNILIINRNNGTPQ